MNLPRTNTAYPICEKCGGNIGLLAFPPKCACRAQPEPAASADPSRDAYEGCREDLLDWKRRALKAEETCRQLTRALGEDVNGTTFMGEPVLPPRDAAPSVVPEPVAWEGGEGWESLAWELCADENGEDACNELIWEGGPIFPEPWGDRWMKYEGEAKRLIALVHKHAAHPPRAPLTDAEIVSIMEACLNDWDWKEFARAVESAVRQEQPHG